MTSTHAERCRLVARSDFSGRTARGAAQAPRHPRSGRELLGEVRRRFSDEERRLADLRADGREWAEIAELVGGTAQARRKQLARAVDRIAREIGLGESDDE